MRFSVIANVISVLTMFLSGGSVLISVMSFIYNEDIWIRLAIFSAFSILLAIGLRICGRNVVAINEKEGFGIVVISWFFTAVYGAVFYYSSGTIPLFTDALFESASGFTTTGSTILTDFNKIPNSIFLWRSLTQWFGGMGIIILALVILPTLGMGSMQLYRREFPGPYSEKLTPHIKNTAQALWLVYGLLTLANILALSLAGMSLFDAINHSMTTMSTGGFSPKSASIGAYDNKLIEWVTIFFMLMGATNFGLHYRLFSAKGSIFTYFKNIEWRWLIGITILVSLTYTVHLILNLGLSIGDALTDSFFQVASIISTTGLSSADHALWGSFVEVTILVVTIIGGCAGSTGGGIKIIRVILLWEFLRKELLLIIHPKAIRQVKLDKNTITLESLGHIQAYLFVVMLSVIGIACLISLDGHSVLVSISAATTVISNTGPGLGPIGPTGNFAHFSDWAKWVLALGMILGRLEFMTILVLFHPRFWLK